MTRWNDYLAQGNALHHFPKRRVALRLSRILGALLTILIIAIVSATVAAEYTRIAQ